MFDSLVRLIRGALGVFLKITFFFLTALVVISQTSLGETPAGIWMLSVLSLAGLVVYPAWRIKFGYWPWPFGSRRNNSGAWGSHMRGSQIVDGKELDKMIAKEKAPRRPRNRRSADSKGNRNARFSLCGRTGHG